MEKGIYRTIKKARKAIFWFSGLFVRSIVFAFVCQSQWFFSLSLLVDAQGPKKDIIFLVDGSDAVGREFPIVQEFIRRIVESLNVGENKIRIGVVQYGDSPHADIYLNTYATKEGVLNAISRLQQRRGSQRNLGQALQFVRSDVLNAARGSRKQEGVPQFLIVVSSGPSTDDVNQPASSLKRSRVLSFSIGTRDVNPMELRVVSYVPSFALTVDDIPGLYTAQEDLITILTELSDEDIASMLPVFPTDDGNFIFNLHFTIRNYIHKTTFKAVTFNGLLYLYFVF